MSAPRGVVLAYHAVGDVAPADDPYDLYVSLAAFARQMAHLARWHRVVPLDDVVDGALGSRWPIPVAITFDDAYGSLLTAAAPVLERHGFPSTVFAPTKWLGQANGWLPASEADFTIVDADGLVELEARNIRVESHGHGHLDFSVEDPATVDADLRRSLDVLEAVLGRRPRHLAYPYGRQTPAARNVAAKAGFASAFTIDELHDGPFAWQRVAVTPHDSDRLFALKAAGVYLGLRHGRVGDAVYRRVKGLLRRNRQRTDDTPLHRG